MGRHAIALPDSLWRLGYNRRALPARLGKFLVVGGTGILVNSFALLLLYRWMHLPLIVASAMAVELAILNNFIWNDRWTFGCSQISWRRFVRFNVVSLGGLVVSTGALWILVSRLGLYYLAANLLGIALATVWNFAASSLWAWGGEE
ncbi:MAG TPA: GtrA family protein [Ktedonobacteraceae bacterium]|nr:GtrA family protein [Ktedonobacteraceae bacterium]